MLLGDLNARVGKSEEVDDVIQKFVKKLVGELVGGMKSFVILLRIVRLVLLKDWAMTAIRVIT